MGRGDAMRVGQRDKEFKTENGAGASLAIR
jgi:hypothetical protein